MAVAAAFIRMVLAGVKTDFDAAYQQVSESADWQAIATRIGTSLPVQQYAWLGAGPTMQAFKDRVEEGNLSEKSYTLADSIYKATLPIERKLLEDDQYGILKMRAQELAQEPVRHWNELAFTALPLGFSTLCYDGQYFFDTDHADGLSGTWSNTTSASLSDTALEAADKGMKSVKKDNGKPFGAKPNVLIVGPANERKAFDLIGSDAVVVRVGDGTASTGATAATPFSNFFKGRYILVVNEYLIDSYAYNWFLADTTRPIKPVIIQDRDDVPVTLEDDMDDGAAKIRERYICTVRGRYTVGYGLPQLAFGSSASS